MAIVRMANKREEIPAGATNIVDVSDRWRPAVDNSKDAWWTPERVKEWSLFTYETHNGFCLENRERNGYDDSDFYMIVWNPEEKAPESIEYASTRGWSYPCTVPTLMRRQRLGTLMRSTWQRRNVRPRWFGPNVR